MLQQVLNNNGINTADEAVEQAVQWRDEMWAWLTDVGMWTNLLYVCLKIAIIFLVARIGIRIIYKLIDKMMERREGTRIRLNTRRMTTIGELLKNVISVTFNFIFILLVLSQMGIELAPLIAGAGVIGLAVGFGAQSLVKDVITGFFIIFEDQFGVGDVIQTGTFKGTVEVIGLRTTRLVSWQGEVYIIPNGLITTVTNFSMTNALAVVDIPIKTEKSLKEAIQLVKKAVEGIQERNYKVTAPPDVLGVQSMTISEYVIRVVAECRPNTNAIVQREIQTEVRKAFEEEDGVYLAIQEMAATVEAEEERKDGA
ncbi:mechanosensitive ion channel family protein [Paenibacillus sp. P96]|uniref:Mechanosensitive ion channel family protein n=1 Tax=Paenibacillus zeirhizosphaerae TaxID=2987519 RepID=A0ABT9FNZ0_9BACL|nr:mechanosensitive ion channel family protein [Paenibacillus sp. P96]MDP4096452.1 mechanosensitive ion channel family protein [Paenibacillus sp. P96]